MDIIDIGENDIDPVSIKINDQGNTGPSVNFGDGIELLMNDKKKTSECNGLEEISKKNKFKIINIRNDLFFKIKDPKKLFPFGLPGGHYNKFGYKIIVDHLLENYFNG